MLGIPCIGAIKQNGQITPIVTIIRTGCTPRCGRKTKHINTKEIARFNYKVKESLTYMGKFTTKQVRKLCRYKAEYFFLLKKKSEDAKGAHFTPCLNV